METRKHALVAWEVLPRVRLLALEQEPKPRVVVAFGGAFLELSANALQLGAGVAPPGLVSVLALPGGELSLVHVAAPP